MRKLHSRQRGFTLIEMLIASTIAGILASVAYPSFTAPLYKARRSDGISALLQLQMSQEQWRANHSTYANLSDLRVPATSNLHHYALELANADVSGYTVAASATGVQANDQGCRVLRLTMAEGQTTYASGPDERTANLQAENKRCWGF